MKQTSNSWAKLLMLMVITASAIALFTVTALAKSPSSALASDDSVNAPAVPTVPTAVPSSIYIGLVSNGKIDEDDNNGVEVRFGREDILRFDPGTSTWSKFLDGSDIGLDHVNVQDFEVLANGDVLFVIDRKKTLPGGIAVTPRDVIRYNGIVFTIELEGSTIGLTKSNENIDALAITPDGHLVISTFGGASVNGIAEKVQDEDLLKIDGVAPTYGTTASIYFDGTAVDLTKSSEDVGAAWIGNPSPNQNLYLATKGNFSVDSLSGKKSDIFGCTPTSFNPIASCFFFSFFNGESNGVRKKIDGISVVTTEAVAVSAALRDLADKAVDDDASDAFDAETYADAMSQGDPEITAEDFIDVSAYLYLPMVRR